MVDERLERYRAKRSFDQTPEPSGAEPAGAGAEPHYVIQKHAARALHYDFRLEADGVLISWAVPKGPSLDPKVKRLAVHVEDHPLDYETFEGVIPNAQYGAGTVIVWDRGTYRNLTERHGRPVGVADAVRAGHLSIWLEGDKLHGGWSLTRTGGGDRGKENWILVKRGDEHAATDVDITATAPASVATGRTIEELGDDGEDREWTRERATWQPPMLAQLVRVGDHARREGQWRYQRKLDGLRVVAVRNGDEVELWSRNHLSYGARFPKVVAALAALPADNFTLDGEVVAYDGSRTSFGLLQSQPPGAQVVYCVFDILHLLGRDTTGLPLADREGLVARVLEGAPPELKPVEALEGGPAELLQRACAEGWEGLVAKRVGSTYRGGRGGDWQKLKCQASQELVVGGWTDPSGSRTGFGALLLGYYDDEGFRYAGKVGTGFNQATLADLHRRLVKLGVSESPFVDRVPFRKGVHWVRPELVAAIAFSEWTGDGRLRHPAFLGLRDDKAAGEVQREQPA
ncbi:MAG TPA: non-homologous end-joining DNA ligase [Acidimicrobiales bacterium]|nr:non-homologous end-joining DNA ligase [Acidimicrobiales bacterium]